MSGLSIGNAPKNYAVLPFYATGAVFFLLLSILMFFAAEHFQGHFFQANLLALVHTAALGWGTMIIFGAAYQLLPVICERNLFSSILALVSYGFLLGGTLLLLHSFWYFSPGFSMILGGTLVFTAALLYLINVLKTARINKDLVVEKLFLISSAGWLVITTAIGLLLAIHLAFPFLSHHPLEVLKLHAHAGLAGWFLQLITGVSIKLIPMFLLGRSGKSHLLKGAFILQNVGLLGFLADQYFFGNTPRTSVYLLLVALGIACWMGYLNDVFTHRLKRKIDLHTKHTFLSFIFLTLALITLALVIHFSAAQWSMLYGTFLFLGWITALILGKTFKTLPFIIWNKHYKNLHGQTTIPMPRDLYEHKWLQYQFWSFLAAIVLLSLGVLIQQILIIQTAILFWIITALLYVLNVAKLFFHHPPHPIKSAQGLNPTGTL